MATDGHEASTTTVHMIALLPLFVLVAVWLGQNPPANGPLWPAIALIRPPPLPELVTSSETPPGAVHDEPPDLSDQ